jgi:transcriptional regulator with XRE-family HTH domain
MDIMLERILKLIGNKRGAIKELATYLGISGNNISDWKSGRAKSYRLYLPQIAEYYGVSLDWLSGNSEEIKKPATPEGYELSDLDMQLIKGLFEMTVQEKLIMLAQIEAYKKLKE